MSDVSEARRAEPIVGGPRRRGPPEIFLKIEFEMVLFYKKYCHMYYLSLAYLMYENSMILSDVSEAQRAEKIAGGPRSPDFFLKIGFEMVLFRAIFEHTYYNRRI